MEIPSSTPPHHSPLPIVAGTLAVFIGLLQFYGNVIEIMNVASLGYAPYLISMIAFTFLAILVNIASFIGGIFLIMRKPVGWFLVAAIRVPFVLTLIYFMAESGFPFRDIETFSFEVFRYIVAWGLGIILSVLIFLPATWKAIRVKTEYIPIAILAGVVYFIFERILLYVSNTMF